jgi:5-methylcytosine-specific restriction endonuclease McrA
METCTRKKKYVLLLNASEEIITVISWKRAITLLFSGKAEKPYNYENYHDIQISNGNFYKLPTAIILTDYTSIPFRKYKPTKRNVAKRDKHLCQYCGKKMANDFTIDHVVPKSRNGSNRWENLVTSCYSCNLKKGNRTPDEAGMKLKSKPAAPREKLLNPIAYEPEMQDQWDRWLPSDS